MRIWWHKVKNWEYWPAYLVYAPTFFYWVIMALKFRSVHFYKNANPGIKNGGLFGDRKSDIYQLLPPETYPKTFLIYQHKSYILEDVLRDNDFVFPLIVKPDVGARGVDVQKVNSIDEIKAYAQATKKDFLIQEFVNLPQELGLFYIKYPQQEKGKVVGLTLKNFLTVEGNGIDNLEILLNNNPRFAMQIPKLKTKTNLSEVLMKDEKRTLVPYGNHNRGTEFLDGNQALTKALQNTFSDLLSPVEGFFYGRLDIRYNSLVELAQGKSFSIIELNGAKSEPTHIYDAKYNFWQGQREIFWYQKKMMKIIQQQLALA